MICQNHEREVTTRYQLDVKRVTSQRAAVSIGCNVVELANVPAQTDLVIGTVLLHLCRLHLIQSRSRQHPLSLSSAVTEMKLGILQKIVDCCGDTARRDVRRKFEVVRDDGLPCLLVLPMR